MRVGQELGVDAVVATRLAVGADGRLTGRYQGRNCRGQEKLDRVRAWMEEAAGDGAVTAGPLGLRQQRRGPATAGRGRRRCRRRPAGPGGGAALVRPLGRSPDRLTRRSLRPRRPQVGTRWSGDVEGGDRNRPGAVHGPSEEEGLTGADPGQVDGPVGVEAVGVGPGTTEVGTTLGAVGISGGERHDREQSAFSGPDLSADRLDLSTGRAYWATRPPPTRWPV